MDRAEYKLIDSINYINYYNLNKIIGCNQYECGEILTNYFKNRKEISARVDLEFTPIDSLYNVRRINGNLRLLSNGLSDLGELRIVNGEVSIHSNPINSLGKLTYCKGLFIHNTDLTNIKHLSEVNGHVVIGTSPIIDLGSLKLIGGGLKLTNCPNLSQLNNLTAVHDDVIIISCPNLYSLSSLSSVGGSIDLRESDLSEFGELYSLGGFIITNKSKMREIPSNLDIVDLKGLKLISSIPNASLITIPKMDKLRNFGLVVIDDDDKLIW